MSTNFLQVKPDSVKWSITKSAAETLSRYTPKGCPFAGYTLLDLLKDTIQMYYWKVYWNTISITDFIRMLQTEGCDKMTVYGDTIISVIGSE